MKKLLSLLVVSGVIFAANSFAVTEKDVINFHNMQAEYAKKWFDFKTEQFNGKMNLLKKEIDQRVQFANDVMSKLSKTNFTNEQERNAFFANKLEKAVELAERKMNDMQNFYEKEMNKARALAEKQRQALAQFKGMGAAKGEEPKKENAKRFFARKAKKSNTGNAASNKLATQEAEPMETEEEVETVIVNG